MNLSIDQALKNAKARIAKGEIGEAHDILNLVLNKYADEVKSLNHELFQNLAEQGAELELPPENILGNLKIMYFKVRTRIICSILIADIRKCMTSMGMGMEMEICI